MGAGRSRSQREFVIVSVLVFVSGGCALIYQALWMRKLSLVFGVSVYAASTALAAFFAGLALGSLLGGRAADRLDRPLRWYGIVEILIGLSALLTPLAFEVLEELYVAVHDQLPDSLAVLTVLRLVTGFLVLIVPATLMGATLPLVLRGVVSHSGELGSRVSVLYATNTAGAVFGTALVGSWLIADIGLGRAFLIGAALNVAVGVVAVVRSRPLAVRSPDAAEPRDAADPAPRPATEPAGLVLAERDRRLVLGVFGVSGFVTLALEVVWFRVLTLYVEATSYAFAVMLATVLIGISAGSYLVAPFMRARRDWRMILAAVEALLAVLSLLSLFFMASAYTLFPGDDPFSWAFLVFVSALGIFPAALVMGAAFPIGVSLWMSGVADDASGSGRRIGVFYSVNVSAGIAGALVGGFVLLPVLGARASVVVLAVAVLASALAVLSMTPSDHRRALGSGAVAVFVVLAVVGLPNPFSAMLEHRYPGERLVWQDEGVQATVTVHDRPDSGNVLYIDGLSQASTTEDVVKLQRVIGLLPVALHPGPGRALVVGLGGGATPGAIAAQDDDIQVDVVELSRGVVHAARFFESVNYGLPDLANVDIVVDDGRNHLLVSDVRYDVITADVIRPGTAGAGKLWSVEYWRLARAALRHDGVMLQWIGDLRSEQYKMIVRSYLEAFPNSTLWYDGQLLVGTKRPLRLDRAAFERRMTHPAMRAVMSDIGITDFDSLISMYDAGPATLRDFVGRGPLLTDDHPRLEFYRPFGGDETMVDLSGIRDDRLTVAPAG